MSPRRTSVLGTVMIAVGVLALALDEIATALFPSQWGGPNIGGGLIRVVALVLAGAGLVVLLRGRRGRQGHDRP